MMEHVRIVEVAPRDGLQNINRSIDESITCFVPMFGAAKRQGVRACWTDGVR